MKLSTCSALVLMVLALSACGGGGGGGSNVTAGTNMPDTPGGTGGGGTGGGGTGGGGTGGTGGGGTIPPRPTTPPQSAGAVTLDVDLATLAGDKDNKNTNMNHVPAPRPSNLAWDIWDDVDDMGDRIATRSPTTGTTASFLVELLINEGESGCEIENHGCRKIAYVDYVAPASFIDDVDDGTGSNLFPLVDRSNSSQKFSTPTTLTWEGEYAGHYRIWEDGAWSIFYSDSGRVTLTANLGPDDRNHRDGNIRFVSENTGRRALYDSAEDERADRATVDVRFKDPGTFDSRGNARQGEQIEGGLFGTEGRATAGVYRLEENQTIQAIGIFGGCRDDDDSGDGVFPCGTFADVPDQVPEVDEGNGGTPDPGPDPVPGPMTVSSMIDYGPWNMRPGSDTPSDDTDDLTVENPGMGQYIARIGGNNVNSEERFYLAGTPTPVQDMPDGVTATWTGTYEGIYRTAAAGETAWPDAFSSDSGTVSFEADFSDGPTYGNIEMTLTSRNADTLPDNDSPGFNSQHARLGNSFTFDNADDGDGINQFIGGKRTSHSEFSMRGGYFGTAAEKVGGVYEINYNAGINPRSTGPSMQGAGVFTADKDE